MKKYYYSLPTTTSIWASFDHGTVEAHTLEAAKDKAIKELNHNVEIVNRALSRQIQTDSFSISIDVGELEIKLEQ